MLYRATQNGQVIVKSSDKIWPTRGGNGKVLQYSCLKNPIDIMKRQKYMTPEDEPPADGKMSNMLLEKRRAITNSSRKNEVAGPTWKWHSVVDVSDGESKDWCCKEQYYIGTWNIRSMNQGKLDVIKQEIVRININILGISEIKWTRMGEFNWDNLYIYYCGQESHRNNGVTLIINKSQKCTTWGNLKNNRMISVHF